MSSVTRLGEEMNKKISISECKNPPSKKNSTSSGGVLTYSKVADLQGDETPPRKKSSLKENIAAAFRSPVFLIRREATKARWEQVRERLKLSRVKISMRDRKRKASKSSHQFPIGGLVFLNSSIFLSNSYSSSSCFLLQFSNFPGVLRGQLNAAETPTTPIGVGAGVRKNVTPECDRYTDDQASPTFFQFQVFLCL
eukprot:NP_496703.1 Uncharacterized protein CELE_Y38E10A.20 [Caenorhabditis elegans]